LPGAEPTFAADDPQEVEESFGFFSSFGPDYPQEVEEPFGFFEDLMVFSSLGSDDPPDSPASALSGLSNSQH